MVVHDSVEEDEDDLPSFEQDDLLSFEQDALPAVEYEDDLHSVEEGPFFVSLANASGGVIGLSLGPLFTGASSAGEAPFPDFGTETRFPMAFGI
jgi:hypothetical protein